MGWKDWSYWKKGAIITTCIIIFLSLILFSSAQNVAGNNNAMGAGIMLTVLLAGAIPLIIFGAIVGWIYGKIKNRNK